jgi:hypothetical protein
MLTNEFCVRGKFLEKRAPHSFNPPLSVVDVSKREVLGKELHTHSPPPLSVVVVSNNWYQRGPSLQALTSLKEIHRHTNG